MYRARVRLLMAYGTEPARKFDLRSVERVVCAGEVLNVPAWEWLQKEVFAEAGVTGRPDELRGEVVSAFVVLKGGHSTVVSGQGEPPPSCAGFSGACGST